MQTEGTVRRIVAFALGTTAIFDVTGTVIYRVLRSGLPPPPAEEPASRPFEVSTMTINDAHREAIMTGHSRNDVNIQA